MVTVGVPIWVDLACDDIESAKSFYAAVLGWHYPPAEADAGGWTMAMAGGSAVAGLAPRRPGTPATWSIYFGCEDIESILARVGDLGGSTFVPGFDIVIDGTRQGRIAAAADPTGGLFGLWQPDAMPGFTASGEAGFPQWFELNSHDPSQAVAFYTRLFDGTAHDIGDPGVPGYTSVTVAGSAHENFGIWSMPEMSPPDSPSAWFVYFGIRDVDAATRRITDAGGKVVMTQDSPHGRWCFAVGTQGEPFYLIDVTAKSS